MTAAAHGPGPQGCEAVLSDIKHKVIRQKVMLTGMTRSFNFKPLCRVHNSPVVCFAQYKLFSQPCFVFGPLIMSRIVTIFVRKW